MKPRIRLATEADVPLIAWVQQEAARSHLPIGFWDLAFPGEDEQRLRIIARIARARPRSFCHWSGFLVAEVDGVPAAALSGYEEPSIAAGTALEEALQQALDEERWSVDQRAAMGARIVPFLTCIPETPEDAWVVEWVATRPEHRGKGVIKTLLEEVIARGRARGHSTVQIGVLIGNTPAQRAYEGAGFRVVDEKRHPDFEAALGSPGIRRLLLQGR
ncbi:MAG: GNAT family N-acetyltransferase [Thermodesulfobacteriota bacterium]